MTIYVHKNTECWIPKATNTHSDYVILITFLPQQWLNELASNVRYTFTACSVIYNMAVGTCTDNSASVSRIVLNFGGQCRS